MGIFDRVLRAGEGRKLKAIQALVPDINALEFWNGIFTCNVKTGDRDAWAAFDMYQLSNNHLISDDPAIRDAVTDISIGDQIRVRGYLAGSGWREYQKTGEVCGIRLPEGLRLADQLPEPIFTPATKADEGHDINVSRAYMADAIGEDGALDLLLRAVDLLLDEGDPGARLALARLADGHFLAVVARHGGPQLAVCGQQIIAPLLELQLEHEVRHALVGELSGAGLVGHSEADGIVGAFADQLAVFRVALGVACADGPLVDEHLLHALRRLLPALAARVGLGGVARELALLVALGRAQMIAGLMKSLPGANFIPHRLWCRGSAGVRWVS